MRYSVYVCDTETTGLDPINNDIIELSLLNLATLEQQTWWMQPKNKQNIDLNALKINGHKLEDLLHQTKEGKEKYKNPDDVIVDIENWLSKDNCPTENRVLCGQNINFDKGMIEHLWKKCNAYDTMPFGRRFIDTMMIEFFLDFCKDNFKDSYSLSSLTKKYGVKNEKAHTAAADVRATHQVFLEQVNFFKSKL